MTPRHYSNARDHLLDAAEQVILRDGLQGLSIEAVVTAAGMSKGGFFHHFKSRDEMMAAVVARLSEVTGAQIEALAAGDANRVGAKLRAQIAVALDLPPAEQKRLRALVLAITAGIVENEAMAATLRAANRAALHDATREGLPLGAALVFQMALDGYWLAEALGTVRLRADEKVAFRQALVALTMATAPAPPPPAAPTVRATQRRAKR